MERGNYYVKEKMGKGLVVEIMYGNEGGRVRERQEISLLLVLVLRPDASDRESGAATGSHGASPSRSQPLPPLPFRFLYVFSSGS